MPGNPPARQEQVALVASDLKALTDLDEKQLIGALEEGDIRLLRCSWLGARPDNYCIQRRQDLEKLEEASSSADGSPFWSCKEAAELVREGKRCVGVLSYGWSSPGRPDPESRHLTAVRRALREQPRITALFWDYCSLHQDGDGQKRSKPEYESFRRAISVMGDLYASAVGTTVLQLKHTPPTH